MRIALLLILCLFVADAAAPKPKKFTKKEIKDLKIEKDKNGWDIAFDYISLDFTSTSITNQKDYKGFGNSRLKGNSQIVAEGAIFFHTNYYSKNFVVFNTIFGEYGRNIISPINDEKIDNTTRDRIILSTDYTQKIWSFDNFMGGVDMGPYVQLSYQTQFVKIENRTQIARFGGGFKIFDGEYFKNLYISLFGEQDFTHTKPVQRLGANMGMKLQYAFNDNAKLVNQINYKHYFLDNYDGKYNPEFEVELDIRVETAIFKHFSVAPFLNLYVLKGQNIDKPASNLMVGVSLSYGQTFVDSKVPKIEVKKEPKEEAKGESKGDSQVDSNNEGGKESKEASGKTTAEGEGAKEVSEMSKDSSAEAKEENAQSEPKAQQESSLEQKTEIKNKIDKIETENK